MPKTTLAPIVRWTIKHEQIVAMHIGGMDNEQIAASIVMKSKHPSVVRVSQILSDPMARRIIGEAVKKVRAQMMESLEDGVAALAVTAMKRIAETINFPDFILGTEEKKHQDRLSLDLVKMVYANNKETIEPGSQLTEEQFKQLTEALEDSKEADELIREAEYEEVG